MRILILVFALCILPLSASAQTATPASSSASTDIGVRIIDQWMMTGTIPAENLSGEVAAQLTPSKLQNIVLAFNLTMGDYKGVQRSFETAPDAPSARFTRYIVTFATQSVDIYLHLEGSKIEGFYLKSPQPAPALDQKSNYISVPAGWMKGFVPQGMMRFGVAEIFYAPLSATQPTFRQNINVISYASDASTIKGAIEKLQAQYPMMQPTTVETKNCGRFPAQVMTMKMTLATGDATVVYTMAVLANLRLYAVTYTRLMSQEESSDAIAAVRSLCDKPQFGGIGYLVH